jgi:hypothetical protein
MKKNCFKIGTLHYYTAENNDVIIPKCTVPSYNISIFANNVIFHLNLSVLEYRTELLLKICLFTS